MRYTVIEAKANKMRFYNLISNVEHESNGLVHTLTATYASGSKFSLTYTEGGNDSSVYMSTTNRSGVTKKLTPHYSGRGVLCLNRENSELSINELIYNLTLGALGRPFEIGEYNHYTPIAWGIPEKFGILQGDIVPRSQNKIHWQLCQRIKKMTGKKCSCPSWGVCYSLLGLNIRTKKGKIEFINEVNKYIASGDIEEVK